MPAKNMVGPGQHLRCARERANMSIEDVADKMRLSKNIIYSLEDENYAALGSFAFVRGYLRGYAKLLNLSADDIIAEFNHLNLKEKSESRANYPLADTEKSRGSALVIRWGGLMLAVILIVLMIIWWQSQSSSNQTTSINSSQQVIPVTQPQQAPTTTNSNSKNVSFVVKLPKIV